jgi:hypothetical protein
VLVNGILERLRVVKIHSLRGYNPSISQIQMRYSSPALRQACDSDRLGTFSGEVAIHFPEGLNEPIVWVFPKVVVCLSCGLAQFPVPKPELSVLARKTLAL